MENERKFIAKVNPAWWAPLVQKAEEKIGNRDGDFVLLWSHKGSDKFGMEVLEL
jgi:hypothetical protein